MSKLDSYQFKELFFAYSVLFVLVVRWEFVEEFHPAFCPVLVASIFSPSPESSTLYLPPVKHPIFKLPSLAANRGWYACGAERTAAFPVDTR